MNRLALAIISALLMLLGAAATFLIFRTPYLPAIFLMAWVAAVWKMYGAKRS